MEMELKDKFSRCQNCWNPCKWICTILINTPLTANACESSPSQCAYPPNTYWTFWISMRFWHCSNLKAQTLPSLHMPLADVEYASGPTLLFTLVLNLGVATLQSLWFCNWNGSWNVENVLLAITVCHKGYSSRRHGCGGTWVGVHRASRLCPRWHPHRTLMRGSPTLQLSHTFA